MSFYVSANTEMTVRVGVWSGNGSAQCIMLLQGAHAQVQADSLKLNWNDIQVYTILAEGDSLTVLEDGQPCVKSSRILLNLPLQAKYKIRLSEGSSERNLKGKMEFKALAGKVMMVNETYVDDYIAGVIEAEAGPRLPPEYYKVQALITRTYVLAHLRRHETEGFNVCDKEHCQVYKGISSKSPEIPLAVSSTSNLVLGDSAGAFIQATFFSNCGGYTVN